MRKTIATILIIIFSTSLFPQNIINEQFNPLITGVPFLTITPDARAGGMGDLGVASTPDISSQYWNPAKYAFMESEIGTSFSFTPWMNRLVKNINLSNLVGYLRLDGRQTISGSFRFFSLGELKLTDYQGQPLGNFHPNDFAVDVAYSLLLSEKLSGSVALRFIQSNLGNLAVGGGDFNPGFALAADVAAYYRTPVVLANKDADLAFGMNILNIGNKLSYDGGITSNFIPTNLRVGTSFCFPVDKYNKISVNLDLNKLLLPSIPVRNDNDLDTFNDRLQEYYDMSPIVGFFKSFSDAPNGFIEELQEVMWSLGVEYDHNNLFFVRSGYFHEHQNKGNRRFFTTGVGFRTGVFQLDASYAVVVNQTHPLDGTLRLGLSFDLSGLKH